MRRIEEETREQLRIRGRMMLEELQARTRSRRDWKGPDMFSEEYKKQYQESERNRIIEEDQAWHRGFNRIMSLPVWDTQERFYFVRDNGVEGDVAYLTDLRIAGEPIGLPSPHRIDERAKHNRILLTYNKDIAAIEFFNSSDGIDLRGITEAEKVKRQLKDRVNVILDPSKKTRPGNLTTFVS